MIVLDMDGVLVDFVRSAADACGQPYPDHVNWDFYEQWGMTANDFWSQIDREGADFWESIPAFEWTSELLGVVSEFDYVVATTPSKNPSATAGKVLGIQRLFGKNFRAYFITPRKWFLGAPGRLLIDDMDENCSLFEKHGGSSLLFPQQWNANEGRIGDRMNYVRSEIEKWKASTQA